MLNKEGERELLQTRRRFVKRHGEKKWVDLNFYLFKLNFSEERTAHNMKVKRWFVRYWKGEIYRLMR